VIEWSVATS